MLVVLKKFGHALSSNNLDSARGLLSSMECDASSAGTGVKATPSRRDKYHWMAASLVITTRLKYTLHSSLIVCGLARVISGGGTSC